MCYTFPGDSGRELQPVVGTGENRPFTIIFSLMYLFRCLVGGWQTTGYELVGSLVDSLTVYVITVSFSTLALPFYISISILNAEMNRQTVKKQEKEKKRWCS